ncbi:hypothetical protein GCM10023084_46790 [Streptomyces lacrimifluminis]|uniref:Uncharacterized protein n=1 Tax=Streptomyces lacrimifluminis TaxID=1500077 RepID=A0A917L7N2_9ACTN|nr:hypothetical protein GCM10012282_51010 [Streptomyces lacrimifluminis]
MSISHAPPGSIKPDISGKSGPGASEVASRDAERALPELEPIVPSSTRRTRVPRWLRRTSGPLLLLALWQLLSSTGALTADILASPGRIAPSPVAPPPSNAASATTSTMTGGTPGPTSSSPSYDKRGAVGRTTSTVGTTGSRTG